jgi:hypothetical protein
VEVDFFMALPSEQSATAVAGTLQAEGFATDIRPLADSVDYPWSVHALKNMTINVNGIREISQRLRKLAEDSGGRYDGWAPGPGKPIA